MDTNSIEEKIDAAGDAAKHGIRKTSRAVKTAASKGERSAVEVVNDLVDRAQDFASKRLEALEDRLGRTVES